MFVAQNGRHLEAFQLFLKLFAPVDVLGIVADESVVFVVAVRGHIAYSRFKACQRLS